MAKKAFITGITGQDGSYLVELLLEKGYEVHGLVRGKPPSLPIFKKTTLHSGNLTDQESIHQIITKIHPDEIYHLAADQRTGYETVEYTVETIAMGTVRLLEAVRKAEISAKFFHASSSLIFGNPTETPQTEETPLLPTNPYGTAKAFSQRMVNNYRNTFGLFGANAILFNHESPRRSKRMITGKIAKGVAEILAGKREKIQLGNLDARRDWGYAPEYVEAMWLMLQQEMPDDYVIATGETHSVREFVEEAFSYAGLDWQEHIEIAAQFVRPIEGNLVVGDSSKAKKVLAWAPKVTFKELVRIMVDADCEALGVALQSNRPDRTAISPPPHTI